MSLWITTMAAQDIPSSEQPIDLVRLVKRLGNTTIARIATDFLNLESPLLHPQQLLDLVSKRIDSVDAERLVRHMLSLHGLARQTSRKIDEVLADLRSSIEADTSDGVEAAWASVKDDFSDLLNTASVRLTAAVIDLAYDYTNILRRTRILTDVRPIYDWDGKVVECAVVSYTLRLRYDNTEGQHEISIAMDELDVVALWEQCERAKGKALAARQLITETCKLPATVLGEVNENDA